MENHVQQGASREKSGHVDSEAFYEAVPPRTQGRPQRGTRGEPKNSGSMDLHPLTWWFIPLTKWVSSPQLEVDLPYLSQL